MSSQYDNGDLHELLHYNPQHRVLICRECQYAIQKSAIESHLLRHKIYRGERRRILSEVAQLEILDPDHVQLPHPSSQPVAELPLLRGLKCVMPDCGMLYASSKSMKRHWSEAHSTIDQPATLAVDVDMQTFFKGTKNRYFQVNALSGNLSQVQASKNTSTPDLTSGSISHVQVPRDSTSTAINMEQLQYFHHFSSATCLVVPALDGTTSLQQKNELVQMALVHCELMAGLLALSAFHSATAATDEASRRYHMDNGRAFEQQLPTIESRSQLQADSELAGVPAVLLSQLCSMLKLFAWARSGYEADKSVPSQSPATLQTFSNAILEIQRGLESRQSQPEADWERPQEVPAPPPAVIRIHKLPYQLISTYGLLKNPAEIATIQSLANGVSECVSLSHVYADSAVVWWNLVRWLRFMTDHFLELVSQRHVVALVILAAGAVMVKRAARFYWFLEGCAERWFALVVAEMPHDVPDVSSLVDGLLDNWPEEY